MLRRAVHGGRVLGPTDGGSLHARGNALDVVAPRGSAGARAQAGMRPVLDVKVIVPAPTNVAQLEERKKAGFDTKEWYFSKRSL